MASKIDISSNALILIGDKPISSFSDPGAGAQAVSNIYDSTVRQLLSMHYWRFSMKKQKLNRLSQEPLNQYKFAFQLPSDFNIVYAVRPNCDYQIFQRFVYSDQNDIDLDYGFYPDEPDMPLYFTKALEYKLASDLAMSVVNDAQVAALQGQNHREALAHAMSIDSRSTPPVAIMDSPFTDVRSGGFGNY